MILGFQTGSDGAIGGAFVEASLRRRESFNWTPPVGVQNYASRLPNGEPNASPDDSQVGQQKSKNSINKSLLVLIGLRMDFHEYLMLK